MAVWFKHQPSAQLIQILFGPKPFLHEGIPGDEGYTANHYAGRLAFGMGIDGRNKPFYLHYLYLPLLDALQLGANK